MSHIDKPADRDESQEPEQSSSDKVYELPSEEEIEEELQEEEIDLLSDLDSQDPPTQAEQLAWGLIDEYLTDEHIERLESLVKENDEARKRFAACLQLHVDLIYFYHRERTEGDSDAVPPVLWPAPLEGLLLRFCPDREERQRKWDEAERQLEEVATELNEEDKEEVVEVVVQTPPPSDNESFTQQFFRWLRRR